jgi:hypothetical protein
MSPEELWLSYITSEQQAFLNSLPFERLSDELEFQLQTYLTEILSKISYPNFITLCQHGSQIPTIEYLCQNFLGQVEYSVDGYYDVNIYLYNALTVGLNEVLKDVNVSDLEKFYSHIQTSRCRYPQPISWNRQSTSEGGPLGSPGLKGSIGTCQPPDYVRLRLEDVYL